MKLYRIQEEQGDCSAQVLGPETSGGVYDRLGFINYGGAWAVSVPGMAINLAQAIYLKDVQQSNASRKILWSIGRNPEHVFCFFKVNQRLSDNVKARRNEMQGEAHDHHNRLLRL